ncbi:hypothetical protein MVI27_04370 [Chryseobacterium salipaludis]|uniref:hypothetical protein n=1 Tax=Chryseobacterium TaxID=59732 RepID=UPI001FF64DB4|nr:MULTISPECIES: hypothetical protein [Chryseobacterium]MCJ8497489.1 hypothetical protein [Chryseobacterium salipaludis]MCX3295897.1 hypothetical protein [Planobacterium sp. JC490]
MYYLCGCMKARLKTFLMLLTLALIVWPSQPMTAAPVADSCAQMSADCCTTKKTDSCHGASGDTSSQEDDCNNSCSDCHMCTLHFAVTYLPVTESKLANQQLFATLRSFNYGTPFFSTPFHNIWQPPKIG